VTDLPTSPCPCSDEPDPQVVSNPPGLPAISYRVDDFTGFRRALLRSLPGEQAIGNWQGGPDDQALVNWRPTEGDLGLQVLEWWAYLADVLTFYNERIANESYLRTAQLPASLDNLVALIGYQPAPGLAATGQVAAVRSNGSPGQELLVPAGMRLASAAANGIPSQTFEVTTTTTTTIDGPSRIPVTLEPDATLRLAGGNPGPPASVLLQGTVSGIKPQDRLLLVPAVWDVFDDSWSWVTVESVTKMPDPGSGTTNTLVTFVTSGPSAGWGPQPTPAVPQPPTPTPTFSFPSFSFPSFSFPSFQDFMLRRPALHEETASAGGAGGGASLIDHIGPVYLDLDTVGPQSGALTTDYRLLKPTSTAALWSANLSGQPAVNSDGTKVHLSASVRNISPGDLVLFDTGASTGAALAQVSATTEALYTSGTVTSTSSASASTTLTTPVVVSHTVLTLEMPQVSTDLLLDAVSVEKATQTPQSVTVRYTFKDVGTIVAVPKTELDSLGSAGVQVLVPTSYDAPAGGAMAFLVDSSGQGLLVGVTSSGTYPAGSTSSTSNVVTVAPTGTPPSAIATGAPLVPPLSLLVDLLPVSRGQTVTNEVLGSGNAALVNQSFTLAKSPLTYLASGNSWTSTLSVHVGGPGGIRWQEVGSFFGQPKDAQVYVVSRSADQKVTTVTFGDGVNGARLPTGTGNVVATYRYGSGKASPPAGTLTTILQPQPLLASIQNPVAVAPGKDPEQPADVRANAPASVFTFGRAISAVDYEVVAAQAPGVARVSAVWRFDGTQQRTLVTVFVGDDANAVAAATAALAGADDPNRPVSVQQATPIELELSCTLVVAANREVDPVRAAALAAVSDPLTGLFSASRMGIGQRLYRSAVDAALSVPGVVAVHDLSVTWSLTVWLPLFLLGGGVSWSTHPFHLELALEEVFDPGEGHYFVLSGTPAIGGVSA
jgi:uncharacterized phage protein gp47/JayE